MARISRLESGRKNLPMFGRDICFNISRRNLGRVLRPDPGREIRASFSCDAAWILGAKSIPNSHVILPGFWARNQYQLSAGFFRFCGGRLQKVGADFLPRIWPRRFVGLRGGSRFLGCLATPNVMLGQRLAQRLLGMGGG